MDILLMSQNTTSDAALFTNVLASGWILTLVVVLPENSYVIWLIATGAGNGVASEFFSLNLSICELFFCLQALFALMSRAFQELWFVVGFLSGFPIIGRSLIQCLICVDCYLAVVHPVIFLKLKPLRYKVICCTAAWIIVFLSCVFVRLTAFSPYLYLFTWYCLGHSLLTFSIMSFCCVVVLRALKQSGPGERRKDREEENHMKRRAFEIIVKIMMAALLVYTSYLFTGLSYVLTNELILPLWTTGQISFLLGGLVQPLLFLHRIGKLAFCKS